MIVVQRILIINALQKLNNFFFEQKLSKANTYYGNEVSEVVIDNVFNQN